MAIESSRIFVLLLVLLSFEIFGSEEDDRIIIPSWISLALEDRPSVFEVERFPHHLLMRVPDRKSMIIGTEIGQINQVYYWDFNQQDNNVDVANLRMVIVNNEGNREMPKTVYHFPISLENQIEIDGNGISIFFRSLERKPESDFLRLLMSGQFSCVKSVHSELEFDSLSDAGCVLIVTKELDLSEVGSDRMKHWQISTGDQITSIIYKLNDGRQIIVFPSSDSSEITD